MILILILILCLFPSVFFYVSSSKEADLLELSYSHVPGDFGIFYYFFFYDDDNDFGILLLLLYSENEPALPPIEPT